MSDIPLIPDAGRVIAAVDASAHARGVADLAAWAAQRLGVPLELLHAIERDATSPPADFSGSLSLGSQEALLAELAAHDEQRGQLVQRQGRTLLDQMRAHLRASAGVEAEARLRHGALVDALTDVEAHVRLFVIGQRGAHDDGTPRHLGRNLERAIRAVQRPVLVAARPSGTIRRFAIAFDGSATAQRCVDLVAASPLLQGLDCHLVTVGADDRHAPARAAALAALQAAGFRPTAVVLGGAPDEALRTHVATEHVDLLVMGAYGHSHLRRLIVGSTTTRVLQTTRVPVLLLR